MAPKVIQARRPARIGPAVPWQAEGAAAARRRVARARLLARQLATAEAALNRAAPEEQALEAEHSELAEATRSAQRALGRVQSHRGRPTLPGRYWACTGVLDDWRPWEHDLLDKMHEFQHAQRALMRTKIALKRARNKQRDAFKKCNELTAALLAAGGALPMHND